MRTRKGKKKKVNKRILIRWIIYFACVILFASFIAFKIGAFFNILSTCFSTCLAKAGFLCANVYIVGVNNIQASEIKKVLPFLRNDSIFKYSIQQIYDRIKSIPWVKTVIVHKCFPDTITIKVEERKASAIFQHDEKLFFIDDEGNKIAETKDKQPSLLVVVGEKANTRFLEIKEIIDKFPNIKTKVKMACLIRERRWDIIIGRTTIKLPEHNAEEKLKMLNKCIQDGQYQYIARAETIDLRFQNKIVVQGIKEEQNKKTASQA
jgi:cell division protein FtsQ